MNATVAKTTLWAHQERALEFIREQWNGGRRGVMLAMEMGCVAGDTEVIVNRGGNAKRLPLRTFYRKFHGAVSVWNGRSASWNPGVMCRIKSLRSGELHLNEVINVIGKGVQPVLKIQLASGKSIRVTPDHEIAAPNDQWIAASDLTAGAEVLTNGQPICQNCGTTERVVTYRSAKYRGFCVPCIYKCRRKRAQTKEKIIYKDGYVRLYGMHSHPRHNAAGQVYEHIVVMERVLGRPITREEHIHHLNHIRDDNRPENLAVLSVPEHLRKHGKEEGYLHLDKAARVCFIPKVDTVVSVEPDGDTDVYDIVMAEPGRNFVANGVIVHNCGKSLVAIEAALEHNLRQILILCPLRVVEVWERQFRQFAPDYAFLALDDRVNSVTTKLGRAREFLRWAEERHQCAAIAINYESSRIAPFSLWALSRTWPLVIADECVPPGSLITTPAGNRPIEDLRPGDIVTGYDHRTSQLVPTRITAVFHRYTNAPFHSIFDARLTPEHPVWTANRGYIPAGLIGPNDEVMCLANSDQKISTPLRTMSGLLLRAKIQQPILQQLVQEQSAPRSSKGTVTLCHDHAADQSPPGSTRKTPPAFSVRNQPFPSPGNTNQSATGAEEDRLLHAQRRQWQGPVQAASIIGRETGMANGVDCPDARRTKLGLPISLQDRHRESDAPHRDRSGWLHASMLQDTRSRRPQRRFPHVTRLDSTTLLEPRDIDQPQCGRGPHPVHNLETETGNYFVDGLLVHNCHRLKNNSGRTSRFAGRLALVAQYRLALTGTPMPHNPLDVWAQYRFVDRSVYDITYTSFKARHAIMGGFHAKQVMGFRDLEGLREKFFSRAFQVGAEVLDLPAELDETYHTELENAAAKTYRSIEEDFMAWLESGEVITVSNALVKLLRLQQLTGGMLPDDGGGEHQVDSSKEKLLEDLLDDIGKEEPVVVFCRFRADLNTVWRAASKLGRLAGELSGSQSDLGAWQRGGERDPAILAVQIQAGGVGIDLTRARYGIYYSLGFSLADYLQSRARIRRPGQTRPVTYYHLIVRNTVDEHVMRALAARQDLIQSVLQHYQRERQKHVTSQQ